MGDPRLTIALVTLDGLEDARDLFSMISAFTRGRTETVVVDNGSTDGTLGLLRSHVGRPDYTLVENGRNVLRSRAMNQALALARTELVVMLCARCALPAEAGWDETIVGYMDANPTVDLAGDLARPDGPAPESRYLREGYEADPRALVLKGHAWVARLALFDEIGGFSEDVEPLGRPEVELSYRAHSFGKGVDECAAIQSLRRSRRVERCLVGWCACRPA